MEKEKINERKIKIIRNHILSLRIPLKNYNKIRGKKNSWIGQQIRMYIDQKKDDDDYEDEEYIQN